MNIDKNKAIKLIEEKIKDFEEIKKNASYTNQYDTKQKEALYSTQALIIELFSTDEKSSFDQEVIQHTWIGGLSKDEYLRDYIEHLNKCIAKLKAYKERIENFWTVEHKNNLENINLLNQSDGEKFDKHQVNLNVEKSNRRIDLIQPLKKTGFLISSIVVVIISLIGFYLPFFPDEIKTLSTYKIINNFTLEFRYFLIFVNIIIVILIYIYLFFRHNLFDTDKLKDKIGNTNVRDNTGIEQNNNLKKSLKCSVYSDLGAYYEEKENGEIYIHGYITVTNISESTMYLSALNIQNNYQCATHKLFSKNKSDHLIDGIIPNEIAIFQFWSYIPNKIFKVGKDIITDITVVDNLAIVYVLNNVRFKYIKK